ncbi:MAG: hypothetical protein BGN88_05365 [Clostridiales bacterium 43-6]|nr:MAG: hypothetical protein BGN88_05365 [Clostridiales bacterium 43-6]
MTIGEKILYIRKENKLSQEEFAEKLGVSRQAVSKWELNDSVPDIDKITLLSELFHVSTDSILKPDQPINCFLVIDALPKADDTPPSEGIVKQAAKKHGYIAGYFLIALGTFNLVLSVFLCLIWSAFSSELSGLLRQFHISFSLQFLLLIFVFMGLVAATLLICGILITTKHKKKAIPA